MSPLGCFNSGMGRQSLISLMYGLRTTKFTLHLNKGHRENCANINISNHSNHNNYNYQYIKSISPYISVFSSFCHYNNNDWMKIIHFGNQTLSDNSSGNDGISINTLVENYYNELCSDSFLYIHDYNSDILNDCIRQLYYNLKEYNQIHTNTHKNSHQTNDRCAKYQSIQLDNTEYYTLRLVSIPRGFETPIHNHSGLCIYTLMNTEITSSNTSNKTELLREIKYINTNPHEDINKRILTRYIDNRDIHFLYTNEYHQLKSERGHCYLLNLYIHGPDIHRDYISY